MARQKGEISIPITAELGPLDQQLRAGVGKLDAFSRKTVSLGKKVDELSTASSNAARGGLTQLEKGSDALGTSLQRTKGKADDVNDSFGRSGESAKRYGGVLGGLQKNLQSLVASLGAAKLTEMAFSNDIRKRQEIQDAGRRGIEGTASAEAALFGLDPNINNVRRMRDRAELAALQTDLTREQSLRLMFDAQSLGFAGQFENVARAAQLVGAPTATAGGLFGQKFGVDTTAAIAAIQAGSVSSLATASDLVAGPAGKGAAAGGAALGASASETIGFLAALSNETMDPVRAGNLMRSFGLKAGADERLQGLGLSGAVEKLRGDSELAKDIFGESQEFKELMLGARGEKFTGTFHKAWDDAAKEIENGGKELATKIANLAGDEGFVSRTAVQNAEDALEIAGRGPGGEAMRIEAALKQRRAAFAASGNIGGETLDAPLIVGAAMRGMSPEQAVAAGQQAASRVMGAPPDLVNVLKEQLMEQKKMNANLQQPPVVEALP